MSPRRIAFSMLAVAGVAVGHIVGYGLAHPDQAAREAALGGHDYLPTVTAAVVPLGVAAALWWAVRTARSLGMAGRIDARRLAAAQVGLFVCQELGERAVGGAALSTVVAERGVWFGLVAQAVVAFVVVRAIETARRVVRFVTHGPPLTTTLTVDPLLVVVPERVPVLLPATVSVGSRAPPAGARP